MNLQRVLAAVLLVLAAWAAEPVPFADGETVVFVGDSITHDGRWHRSIADFYATRFPERRIAFINAGLSGDTAGGALRRLADDVLRWKPTTTVVMLGMNDCGRDAYKPGSDGDAQMQAIRERMLATYGDNMGRLAAGLAAPERRLVLLTPSPYEDAAILASANLPGANAGLGRGAAQVAALARSAGAALVDLHAPMTALDRERQRQDPAFTLIGPDRVHPGSPGHLVMAWLFLRAQGVPALVSRTVIDAGARTTTAENATISGAVFAPRSLTFTLAARSLPFPITADARPALAWAPIAADLDREELVVRGLAAGTWTLAIDDAVIAGYPAAELAAGVDLALVATTPQYRQAQQVLMRQEERRALERRLRAVAMVEWRLLKPGEADLGDPAQVLAAIDRRLAEQPAPFLRTMLEECRASRSEVPALRERLLALSETVRQAAQPVPRRYRLTLAP